MYDKKQTVSFEELLTGQMIQLDTVTQLLIEKGIITEKEFHEKLKAVQAGYERARSEAKERRQAAVTLKKIVSGGQTGAQRAALDVAIGMSIPHGGWAPKARKAEDGPVPDKYLVSETASYGYKNCAERKMIDSDGTVIVSHGRLAGVSHHTWVVMKRYNKPRLHLDMNSLSVDDAAEKLRSWLKWNRIEVLNIAGHRESRDAGIYQAVFRVLEKALKHGGATSPR
ncbi:putative molybdenum carrier protein [Thermodesulfobacteriota bacterium]